MRGARLVLGVRQALKNLNPEEVRAAASTPVLLELGAPSPEADEEMERLLVPAELTPEKRAQARAAISRPPQGGSPDIRIYEASMPHPEGAFLFRREDPKAVIREVLAARPELHLSLARTFPGFRECVTADLIKSVAKENAMFSLATAIPSMIPLLSLPFAVGEFASDAAFLTVNQVRLAFLLAAASGRPVGYREQKTEIGSIIASAFGWRALARQLVGKIPLGAGLIPKAAVAFAGTYVVGASIERYYRLGYGYTPSEKEAAYKKALEAGKVIASAMLDAYRTRRTA